MFFIYNKLTISEFFKSLAFIKSCRAVVRLLYFQSYSGKIAVLFFYIVYELSAKTFASKFGTNVNFFYPGDVPARFVAVCVSGKRVTRYT